MRRTSRAALVPRKDIYHEMIENLNNEIHCKVSNKIEYLIYPNYSKVTLNKKTTSKPLKSEKKES